MGGEDQLIRVDEIALNDQKLEEKAKTLVRFVEVPHTTVFLIVVVR
jgi:hypothetical protein